MGIDKISRSLSLRAQNPIKLLDSPTKHGTISRQPSRHNHHAPATQSAQNRNHVLSRPKSLQKKMDAASRGDHLSLELKSDTYVLTLQAGYYECLKSSMVEFINSTNSLKASAISHTDTSGATEQTVITIKFKNNHKFCTVTLYNTVCKLIVNGSHRHRFINETLRDLNSYIQDKLQSLGFTVDSLNHQLVEVLTRANCAEGKSFSSDSAALPAPPSPQFQDTVADNDPVHTTYLCPVCDKDTSHGGAICCDVCQHWIHYTCDKLKTPEITDLENDSSLSYTCRSCKILIPGPPSPPVAHGILTITDVSLDNNPRADTNITAAATLMHTPPKNSSTAHIAELTSGDVSVTSTTATRSVSNSTYPMLNVISCGEIAALPRDITPTTATSTDNRPLVSSALSAAPGPLQLPQYTQATTIPRQTAPLLQQSTSAAPTTQESLANIKPASAPGTKRVKQPKPNASVTGETPLTECPDC